MDLIWQVIFLDEARYHFQWPRDGLYLECFIHEILNYRYHWHSDQYELNILLKGSQEFSVDRKNYRLEENDVLLVPPGSGHASYAPNADTAAMVLHFSASAFRPFAKKGTRYLFPACISSAETRDEARFRKLRFYAGQIFSAAHRGGPYSQLKAKANLELLLVTLCEGFAPQEVPMPEEDPLHQETLARMIHYIEDHYAEKLSLETLAQFSQYNRTYVSTLFKNTVGVNFYDYLTRVRFQHALTQLVFTDKTLTAIAMDNGFADLKSFNKLFRDATGRAPAEYRAGLDANRVCWDGNRSYVPPDAPLIRQKLEEFSLSRI